MALFREVLQHPQTKLWAFVEYSDETKSHIVILGNKEFDTPEQAAEYSKGFEDFSYIWKDPIEIRKHKLLNEKARIEDRLQEINKELEKL